MPKSDSSNPNGGPSFQGPRYRPNWLAAILCFIVATYLFGGAARTTTRTRRDFQSTGADREELGGLAWGGHGLGAFLLDRGEHVPARAWRSTGCSTSPSATPGTWLATRVMAVVIADHLDVGPAGHDRERQAKRHVSEGAGGTCGPDHLPADARRGPGPVWLRAPAGDRLLLRAALCHHQGHRLRDREDHGKLRPVARRARPAKGRARRGAGKAEGGACEAARRVMRCPHRPRSRCSLPWAPRPRRRWFVTETAEDPLHGPRRGPPARRRPRRLRRRRHPGRPSRRRSRSQRSR